MTTRTKKRAAWAGIIVAIVVVLSAAVTVVLAFGNVQNSTAQHSTDITFLKRTDRKHDERLNALDKSASRQEALWESVDKRLESIDKKLPHR